MNNMVRVLWRENKKEESKGVYGQRNMDERKDVDCGAMYTRCLDRTPARHQQMRIALPTRWKTFI
jgi:hypothetical protein